MWLFILTIITVVILYFSFSICGKDLMHPVVVFNLFFLISEFTCIIFSHEYEIALHYKTVLTLILGELTFFFISALSYSNKISSKNNFHDEVSITKIEIRKCFVIGLIICQIISIFSFIVYIRMIYLKYVGSVGSLGSMINLYDQANKFFSKELAKVPIPIAYRLSNPIGISGGHIMLYVLVNNWISTHKIDLYHLVSVILLIIIYVLNGSRTPIFRLITIALILFYVLYFKKRSKKIDTRFYYRLAMISLVTVGVLLGMLFITGRLSNDSKYKLTDFLFVYIGAPIVNLDNWLANPVIIETSFIPGSHTFSHVFSTLGDIFNIDEFHTRNILLFQNSDNGKFLGNVYTMYYPYVYDFGILGVVPLTAVVALFYSVLYDRMFAKKICSCKVSFRLFFYSYLFNDLMMSIFSARFYETIFNKGVIKIFIISYILIKVFIEGKFPVSNTKIKIQNIKFEL